MSLAWANAVMPHLVLTAGLMLLLLVVAFRRSHALAMASTVLILVVAGVLIPQSHAAGSSDVLGMMRVDGYAQFFTGLFLFAAIVTVLISFRYLDRRASNCEEFYMLILTATLGAMVMAAASHFATLILGLEILSISLYAMICYPQEGKLPLEAAAKYLVLSGVASTTMLFGIALIYAASGSLSFSALGQPIDNQGENYYWLGQGMLVVGLAFKLSLVPFHMWTPDVYQGAPAPVTGFLATVSKGAVFVVLLRYIVMSDALSSSSVVVGISVIAMVSMVVGNLLALLEKNIKRILAFSSIAHVGYLLIALLVVGALDDPGIARETTMVYLAGYFLMTLAAFGVISALSISASSQDNEQLADYEGLFWRHPVLAAVLTTAALSLAGIPLTMGFIAKFYLFAAGVQGALWILLWALVIGSAIGIYYYLRIVFTMTRSESSDAPATASDVPMETVVTAGVLGVAVILFGVYPTPLIELVRSLIGTFGA